MAWNTRIFCPFDDLEAAGCDRDGGAGEEKGKRGEATFSEEVLEEVKVVRRELEGKRAR